MTIAIYGPGGFGSELLAFAGRDGREVCFLSDSEHEIGQDVLGVPVRAFKSVAAMPADAKAGFACVIAVADAVVRRKLADKLAVGGLPAGSVIAPSAILGPGVTIGEGAILCHNSIVTAQAVIGRHFHANIFSYVAHDCVIGDFVTLAPRVCVNGNTIVGDDAYIGTGAVIKQGVPGKPLRIGRGAVIGMGAVVTKDVPEGAIVVGNPARPLSRD